MALDVKLFYLLNGLAGESYFSDTLIIFFADYLQYVLALFFVLFLLFSVNTRREKIRVLLATTSSMVISRLVITEIIRFFYHRPRPFLAYNVHQLMSNDGYSFPSGHAAFFFAMAGTIYGYDKKWGLGFFAASIFMGLCRIIAGIHYPSDIIGGMAIGMAVAYFISYFFKKEKA